MSAQPPTDPDDGHSDCSAVIADVWTLLDGEVTEEKKARLRLHLDHCPACLRHYGVEERVKNLIATKCGGETVPEEVVARIRLRISQTTIIRYS